MAQDKIEFDTKDIAALVRYWNLFAKVGSPNHCHQVPGRWDGDTRHKKGSKCHECAMHDKIRDKLKEAL